MKTSHKLLLGLFGGGGLVLDAPTLVSPADDALLSDTTPTLVFTTDARATSWRVQIDQQGDDFASPVLNVVIDADSDGVSIDGLEVTYVVQDALTPADGPFEWQVFVETPVVSAPSETRGFDFILAPLLLARFTGNTGNLSAGPYTPDYGDDLTIVVTDGTLSEDTDGLTFTAQSSAAWGDLGFYGPAFARAAGRVFFAEVTLTTINNGYLGWLSGAALAGPNFSNGVEDMVYFDVTGPELSSVRNARFSKLDNITTTTYQLAIVLRSTGSFVCVKGGAKWTDWTLLYINPEGTDASINPGFVNWQSAGKLSRFGVADFLTGWGTDADVATQRLTGARSAGDTFTHVANGHIGFTITTLPASGSVEVRFRIQDANNYMRLTISSTGGLGLDEVIAGTPNSLGTAAGAAANGRRILVSFEGAHVTVYCTAAALTDNRRIESASATSFQSETDGELESLGTSGAVSDIVAWPYALAGTQREGLNQLFTVNL